MKRIKPEELPKILDKYTIDILVEMCEEFPKKTFDWVNISQLLEQRGELKLILDIVEERQNVKAEKRKASMSESEKEEQRLKRKRMLEKLEEDPHTFYGNMGQPETLEEFKNRYGVYPPGYDENGNKIEES